MMFPHPFKVAFASILALSAVACTSREYNSDPKDESSGATPALTGDFQNASKTQTVSVKGGGLLVLNFDSTGKMLGAHPNKYVVEWSSATAGKVFETKNSASGEKMPTSCGTVAIDAAKQTLQFSGGCSELEKVLTKK